MANEKENFQSLLEKDVKVSVRRGGSQRETKLRIFVGYGQQSSLSSKKELHVRLTDENDPFFLHFLYLAEDDFQKLKEQQGLLVDFSAFPQKFIDLIDLCSKEEGSQNPRFLLQFITNGSTLQSNGQLDIVETNPFKHLVHLSLKFLPGNDEEIKKYLVMCIKNLKDDKLSLEKKVEKLEETYSSSYSTLTKQLDEKSTELEELKSQWTMKINDLSSKHLHEMSSARQQEIKLQNDYEDKLKLERTDWEEKYHRKVSKLEQRNTEIESINKDLIDKKFKSESLIRELKIRNSSMEEECRRINKDLQTTRRQNSNLDSDRHEKDKTLNHLRTRVAVLEQELKDKEMVISRSSEMLESSNSQKKILDDELKEKGNLITRLEGTIKSSSEEINKGNEIIKKLQNEIRNLKSQLKLKNIVTTKQERIIEEKEALLVSQKKNIDELNSILSDKDQELHKRSDELQTAQQKLEENQELLKTNENVINWLNKQLNDQMLGSRSKYSTLDTAITAVNSLTNSNASKFPSKFGLHHSTPASGCLPTVSNTEGNVFNQVPSQVLYRPPRRAPPAWQSPPSNASDSLAINSGSTAQSNRRQPLRQRMPVNQPIKERTEPVVDMKYLQTNARDSAQNRKEIHSENGEDGCENKAKAKPFLVQVNLEKENRTDTKIGH